MAIRIGLSYRARDAYDIYARALVRRGHSNGVEVRPVWLAGPDRPLQREELAALAGVVLTGGADVEPQRYGFSDPRGLCSAEPARDAEEWALLEHLRDRPVPLLAICRGAQLLNVFYGGSLIPDLGELNAMHRGRKHQLHWVEVAPGTQLASIVGAGPGRANSSHHQAVERLAKPFVVNARATDGTIEGYERPVAIERSFTLAVQWHPEEMKPGLPLADGVLDALLRASMSPLSPKTR